MYLPSNALHVLYSLPELKLISLYCLATNLSNSGHAHPLYEGTFFGILGPRSKGFSTKDSHMVKKMVKAELVWKV